MSNWRIRLFIAWAILVVALFLEPRMGLLAPFLALYLLTFLLICRL